MFRGRRRPRHGAGRISERLDAAAILSYRVLRFEREGEQFLPPSRYPLRAAACTSTHDLPTIRGWWNGVDLLERERLGQIDPAAAQHAKAERQRELDAMRRAIAVQDGHALAEEPGDQAAAVIAAAHRYVAATPSALVLLQADDLAAEVDAINLPGTDRERPNWRRKVWPLVSSLWQGSIGSAARRDMSTSGRSNTPNG